MTTRNIHDHVLPQDIDAEMSLLGSIMIDNEAIKLIGISGREFHRTAHRKIFEVMRKMEIKNIAIDLITLSDELKKRKILDEIGGAYYLTELSEIVPSSANITGHEEIVKSKWRLRELISLAHDLSKQSYEGKEEINDIINGATDKLISLSDVRDSGSHISDCLHAFNDLVDRRKAGEIVSVNLPFIGDVDLGETVTVACRPSVGKSAISTQAFLESGVPTGYIILESTKEKITGRMLAQVTKIDSTRLKYGNVYPNELTKLTESSIFLASAPVWIEDKVGRIGEILALAYKWKAQHDIKLLVLDYMQLVDGVNAENENARLSSISRQIVRFGVRNKVAILNLSQLNRAGVDRPQLHHLRGSGSIEQDSDQVVFLHRPKDKIKTEVEIIKAKNKDGELFSKNLIFQPEILTFSEGLQ